MAKDKHHDLRTQLFRAAHWLSKAGFQVDFANVCLMTGRRTVHLTAHNQDWRVLVSDSGLELFQRCGSSSWKAHHPPRGGEWDFDDLVLYLRHFAG